MKIGIDMGGTNMRVSLIDGNKIVLKSEKPTLAERSKDEILEDLISLIEEVITPSTSSIGIGVPSVVDTKLGIVYNVANIPSWDEVHLKKILENKFEIPVSINNDANCFALGELIYGEGQGFEDLVCMAIGTGVGAGLILNGKLYEGSNAGAGEIGSFPYLDNIFEYYCSGQFFIQEHNVKGSEVARKATQGDKEALELYKTFGHHIGNLINAVLFAYDPQAIIIGGSIVKSFDFYKEEMYKVIETFPYPATTKNLKILLSQKENISILGAAELNK